MRDRALYFEGRTKKIRSHRQFTQKGRMGMSKIDERNMQKTEGKENRRNFLKQIYKYAIGLSVFGFVSVFGFRRSGELRLGKMKDIEFGLSKAHGTCGFGSGCAGGGGQCGFGSGCAGEGKPGGSGQCGFGSGCAGGGGQCGFGSGCAGSGKPGGGGQCGFGSGCAGGGGQCGFGSGCAGK